MLQTFIKCISDTLVQYWVTKQKSGFVMIRISKMVVWTLTIYDYILKEKAMFQVESLKLK
jgi:hypothetical protein